MSDKAYIQFRIDATHKRITLEIFDSDGTTVGIKLVEIRLHPDEVQALAKLAVTALDAYNNVAKND